MASRSPTWGDIEAFLKADGWTQLPASQRGGARQRHIHFEKALPDGRLLRTQISHSRQKSISPGRFAAILRDQLAVSSQEFWQAIETGEPVDRPVTLDEPERVEHEGWVVQILVRDLHMDAAAIAKLDPEEAVRLVHEYWSKPDGS